MLLFPKIMSAMDSGTRILNHFWDPVGVRTYAWEDVDVDNEYTRTTAGKLQQASVPTQ